MLSACRKNQIKNVVPPAENQPLRHGIIHFISILKSMYKSINFTFIVSGKERS